MSKRKRQREAPMPASTLGLLMFFEEPSSKVKIKPAYIIGFTIFFILISGLLLIFPIIP